MGIIISEHKKRECLAFIRDNFDNLSQRKIAKLLNLGKTTVNRWAQELGFKFKKHTVNEYFFDKFNENSSYILGFIAADGNVNYNPKRGYYTITITAAEKDKTHLENLRNIMFSTKPLLYSSTTKSYRLIINSKKLCEKLIALGITPKKSLTLKFPKIPNSYLRHFIRGIVDGDGNVRYVKRKRSPYFEITIASGSYDFCQGIVDSLKDVMDLSANIRTHANNVYVIQYSCSRGEKLAEFLYKEANLYLERKYLPYKDNILGG